MSLDNEKVDFLTEEDGVIYDLDEYDEDIVIEIEVEDSDYNAIYESYLELNESGKIDRNITISTKPEITILTRNKNNAGGSAGNPSQHGASVKIIEPKRLKGVSISIPAKSEMKDESKFIIKGDYNKNDENIIKTIKDAIIKNRFDFANIFYTDKDYSAVQSYKRLINRNIDFKFYDQPNSNNEEDNIYSFYKEKRGLNE